MTKKNGVRRSKCVVINACFKSIRLFLHQQFFHVKCFAFFCDVEENGEGQAYVVGDYTFIFVIVQLYCSTIIIVVNIAVAPGSQGNNEGGAVPGLTANRRPSYTNKLRTPII